MDQITNLTPHPVMIIDPEGCEFDTRTRSYHCDNPRVIIEIKPESGSIPRCQQTEESAGEFAGVPLIRVQYGKVENLPEQRDGVMYIVSALAATAGRKSGRTDLLVPSRLVRDANGTIVGCLALATE